MRIPVQMSNNLLIPTEKKNLLGYFIYDEILIYY